jgi:hypothetical protein
VNSKRTEEEARRHATPEEFIKAWQTSRTLREACTKLRMKRAAAKVRAYRYRELGVPLKRHEIDPAVELPPNRTALAQYAASLVAPSVAPSELPAARPEGGSAPAPE